MIRLKRLKRYHALILNGNYVLAHCFQDTDKLWHVLGVKKHLVYLKEVGTQPTLEDSLLIYIKNVYEISNKKGRSRQKFNDIAYGKGR